MGNSRFEKFTERTRRALAAAQEEAHREGAGSIEARHLALGMLQQEQGMGPRALGLMGVNALETAQALRKERADEPGRMDIGLDDEAKRAIELAVGEAARTRKTYMGTEHLLVGLMELEDSPLAEQLTGSGVTIPKAREAIMSVLQRTGGQAAQGS